MVLGILVQTLNIPLLFLDTVGTIFGAIALGPFLGALIGGISNIVLSIVSNPTSISFALANITLGFLVGFVSKKRGFSYKEACIIGLVLAIICPIISTPISLYLFGGLSNNGASIFSTVISKSSEIIFSGVFIPRLVSNMLDKILSCLFVAFLLTKISKKYLDKIGSNNDNALISSELIKNN